MRTPWIRRIWRPEFGLVGVLVVYSLLLLPVLNRQGISWDEQVDIWVARAYLKPPHGWLYGSQLDPSQTRLPAAAVALVYALLHIDAFSPHSSLLVARAVSWEVGALTLMGVYVYGKRRFDTRRGVLASALLATSPFFLSFARVAFTETDIYLACTLIWLIVGIDRFQDRPTILRSVWVGVLMGLCLSAKFTAVAVLPAIWWSVFQTKRHSLPGNPLRRKVFSGFLLSLSITGVAALTFLLVPPEHLLNSAILNSLFGRINHEMTYQVGFMGQAAALHILSILFKSSVVIGAGMLLSLILETFQLSNWRIQFPLLAVWLYFGCLVVLPLAQTFYTVPLLPILVIFTADRFLALYSRKRVLAIGLAALAGLALSVDLILCYPDYNLNGYQWLGKRILAGRPSIGYRSVVQTPSDGVEQAVEWLNEHAGPGQRVRAYLLSWHIVQAVAPDPAYRLENGFQRVAPGDPDFVVVEINAQIRQSWWIKSPLEEAFRPWYDENWLNTNYEQVFTVKRAFGIEMASVYQKK